MAAYSPLLLSNELRLAWYCQLMNVAQATHASKGPLMQQKHMLKLGNTMTKPHQPSFTSNLVLLAIVY